MVAQPAANESTNLPVFHVLRENRLENLLNKWLRRSDLDEVVLVSFGFNPRYQSGDATLAKKLELLGSRTDVTLVTVMPESSKNQRFQTTHQRQALGKLVSAGVKVLIHDRLHAKAYLFKRGDRVCWIVGSSNLTFGGLSENTEVNVAGYRYEEYLQVATEVNKIKGEAYIF